MKIKKIYIFFLGGGGGGRVWGGKGQGRCEQRSEVFVKIKKEKLWGVGSRGGGGSGWGEGSGWM